MTKKEAYDEILAEFNEFIDGCDLRGREEEECEKNPEFKMVYTANLMALEALKEGTCEDCISREKTISTSKTKNEENRMKILLEIIKGLICLGLLLIPAITLTYVEDLFGDDKR